MEMKVEIKVQDSRLLIFLYVLIVRYSHSVIRGIQVVPSPDGLLLDNERIWMTREAYADDTIWY